LVPLISLDFKFVNTSHILRHHLVVCSMCTKPGRRLC